jgi:membrane-associated protease RseP (regulator of RpoE activity)
LEWAQEGTQGETAWPRFWWVNGLFFLATLVTTTVYGAAITACFEAGQPLNTDLIWAGYLLLVQGNVEVWRGLLFSGPLLCILMAHELGHYFACRYWKVNATLPFFLPSPLLLGTFGAFIRIKSPIYRRRALFDIGISGPLAGFVVIVPVLLLGILWSKQIHHIAAGGDFVFGTPLLMRIMEWLRFPAVHPQDIALHPFAQAAWAGLLATAVNLLPIGQLDGGHILYALFGKAHQFLSRVFLLVLIPMGYFSYSWLFWAVLLFFLGIRHPLVYDDSFLDKTRKKMAVAALAIFLLSLCLAPVRMP